MSYFCYKCGTQVEVSSTTPVGRKEECPKCSSDMHVCLNCKFYDASAYNECKEPQAERILDKDRGNFCDYFTYLEGKRADSLAKKESVTKALDDLFK